MKNLKCVVGATLLTPVCFFGAIGAIACIVFVSEWLKDNCPYLDIVLAGITLLIFAAFIWIPLYLHCVKSRKQTGKKKRPIKPIKIVVVLALTVLAILGFICAGEPFSNLMHSRNAEDIETYYAGAHLGMAMVRQGSMNQSEMNEAVRGAAVIYIKRLKQNR